LFLGSVITIQGGVHMTTTKTIRMTNETAEFLKGKDARMILEGVCELISKGKIKYNASGLHISENGSKADRFEELFNALSTRVVPEADKDFKNEAYTNLKIVPVGYDKALKDEIEQLKSNPVDTSQSEIKASDNLEVMCALNGISVGELLNQIEGMMDDGKITIDGGRINFYDGVGEVLNGLHEEMRNLKDACDEKGIEISKALDKAFRTGIEMASRDIWHL